MAQLVPERPPTRATAGERRLFTALGRALPPDCVVYYEPLIERRYPDFVLILPSLGVLTVEVKDWRAEDILGADDEGVLLRSRSRGPRAGEPDVPGLFDADASTAAAGEMAQAARRLGHPTRQAREYMFRLMDQCRRVHPAAAGHLLHADGPHQGGFKFPFGHVAILSRISEEQLRHHPAGDLTAVFPAQRVLPREALEGLEHADPEECLLALQACFDPWWPIEPMNKEQVQALRAAIHPEIVVGPVVVQETLPLGTDGKDAPGSTSLPVPELRVLDLRQERHARALGGGHRLVFGVAGSGKTVLLVARARLLAQTGRRVLVLCFNVSLAAWLRATLAKAGENVVVHHFDGWAKKQGVVRDGNGGEDDAALGARLLAHLEEGVGDARAYDAVLIDEAQDFEPGWFRCALAAMRDPEAGDLLIVGDGAQGLYRRGRVSWRELGVQAQGRSVSARFDLTRNYRNSAEIMAVAGVFANSGRQGAKDAGTDDGDDAEDGGVGAPTVEVARCRRSTGLAPRLVRGADRLDECRRAYAIVRELLAGRWEGRDVPPLAPAEIGILYPPAGGGAGPSRMLGQLADGLSKLAPTVWLSDPQNRTARSRVVEPGVKLQTIHSAKGLQYRAVVLLWADLLGRVKDADRSETERRLFYVGLTRAEDLLAVLWSGAGSPLTTRLVAGTDTPVG